MSNLKESILQKAQLAPVQMTSSTLGMEVYIKRLPANQVENWSLKRLDKKTGKADWNRISGYRNDLVQQCLCDEDGNVLFGDASEIGAQLSNETVEELFGFCQDVNAIKKAAVEEAEGNS